jgi:hypothetical protein
VKKFDCGIIGKELCIARDPEHHYLIKFTLKNAKWILGCKRGQVRVKMKGNSLLSITGLTMTIGYYEEPVELGMHI